VCTKRGMGSHGLVIMSNGMLVLVNHLVSSTKDHVWQVSRVQGTVGDMVRGREKGQGMWVHGGDYVSGMVWP
jgi:hypothetical protein